MLMIIHHSRVVQRGRVPSLPPIGERRASRPCQRRCRRLGNYSPAKNSSGTRISRPSRSTHASVVFASQSTVFARRKVYE
jgi:hypothetical protein